jgi:type I restriction enzyme, S subunit
MSEQVPEGWKIDKLGRLCSSIRGVSYKPENLQSRKSKNTATLLRSNNIQESGLDFKDVQYVDIDKVKTKQIALEGDIAVCMSNGSRRLVGKNSLFSDVLNTETFTVGAFCSIIRTNENSTHQFVRHLLKSNSFTQQVDLSLAGSAINNLKDGDVEDYTFLLPPLPEQKKIASILTSVDEVIEKTQSQIDKLQDLKKGTMNELLTKGIGHTEFKDSDLGRIPKSWEVKRLEDCISSFQNGYAFSSSGYVDEGIPIISIVNISLGGKFKFDKTKEKKWSIDEVNSLQRYLVREGDLIMAMTDVTPNMAVIGRGAIVRRSQNSLLNQRVGLIRTNEICTGDFLAYVFNGQYWRYYSKISASLGAQANIGTQGILSGLIAVPGLDEQIKITEILNSLDEQIEVRGQKVSQTQSLKKSLMQDLLTGKVRVSVN